MQTGVTAGQSGKLRGRIGRADEFVALRLDGIIDEHNGLDQWLAAVGTGGENHVLLVDMGGVRRLNSVGVRDWVNWLRALRTKWRSIVLFDCPPAVMNEVNFVKNFAEGAIITTFQVPLFCQVCQKEESRILDALTLKHNGGNLPKFNCERSDCKNALDDDEESYLSFLAALPSSPDAERLSRLTTLARDLLKSNEGAQPVALDAASNASPARANALSQLGMSGSGGVQSAASRSATTAGPATPVPSQSSSMKASRTGDWLFIGAIAAMVAVLGVLIYLLMTLE